jgi:tetratricopeptide (TPR) repeat protein
MLDPKTTDILRQALGAVRAGDVAAARRLAEIGLAQGGDVVALNAFLGTLLARSGDAAGAIRHLKLAHRGRPDDATIATNLIAAQIEAGDPAGALEAATLDLALADPSLRIARYRGFLSQSLEQFDDAVEAYSHVVERAPDDFESWNNLGNALMGMEKYAESVTALERAVALDPGAAPTRINLALALRAAERLPESEKILRKAAEDFPQDIHALNELYLQLKLEWRQEEVVPVLERAAARAPDNADLQLKLGVEYGLARRVDDAVRAFDRAIAIDVGMTDAYLGLAVQYEHSNREDEFAPLLVRAEANRADPGAIAFVRALEHRRAKRFEEALADLALVPPEIEPERTIHIRATVLDRLGRTDEAFADFAETARLHQENPSDPLRRAAELRADLESEVAKLTPGWVAGWTPAAPTDDRPDPVFLVGFPRSGTTLLDTILMGHPGTTVLEEQPPLNHVDRAIGGMAALAAMDDTAIARARDHYFEEVAKIEEVPPGNLLIDKSPMFLNKAPLIARIFPNARFILALRHPCDVLLSCYMSNFRLNSAMANFLRLEDAAAFYDVNFRHFEAAHAALPMRVHTVYYEQLVEDVAAEMRPLLDFLQLDWHEDALDHTRTARSRGLITTASYSQVTEPIYKRASGRWLRYREHLAPILPVVGPWAEKFGYSL